jgi:hypothetical protein
MTIRGERINSYRTKRNYFLLLFLLTVHYSLFTAPCSPLPCIFFCFFCSLLTVHCSLPTGYFPGHARLEIVKKDRSSIAPAARDENFRYDPDIERFRMVRRITPYRIAN